MMAHLSTAPIFFFLVTAVHQNLDFIKEKLLIAASSRGIW